MAKTINGLNLVTSAAAGEFLAIWRAANGDTTKITKANFMGGVLVGGGTLATGGFTLTVNGASVINGSVVGNISGSGTIATGGFTLTVSGTSTINGSLVGSITGSGTLAAGGFTLTVPATGTAALITGTPTVGRVASWNNSNTVQDAGIAVTNIPLLDAANTFTARQTSVAFSTAQPGILDDTVYSFTPPNAAASIWIAATNDSTVGGVYLIRAAATVYCASLVSASNVNVTTGVLAGTTGTDGKLTVSAHSDGKIYIENRRGASLTIKILVLS
jgi:hypothetical protein